MKILFSFRTTRKEEFPGVVHGVLEIVEKHNPEAMHIDYFYGLLLAKTDLVDQYFSSSNNSHPLSGTIKDERKRRVELVLSILSQKTAVERAKLETQTEAASKVFPIVNKYLSGFRTYNLKIAGQKLNAFIGEIDGSEALKSATSVIGIDVFIDELKVIQSHLSENQSKRLEDNSNKRILTALKVKDDAGAIMMNLFKSIELAEVQYPEVDYSSLVSELNEFLSPYRALSLLRSTIREKAKKETVAPSTTTSATAT